MIGVAGGLALGGKIPYPSSFAAFLPGRCYDQIRQTGCYSNLNIKFVSTHAGLTVGQDGATHQMMEDIAMLRATPNIQVIVPCDAREAEKAVIEVSKFHGPVYIRLGREKIPVLTLEDTPFKVGVSNTLKSGEHVTIIATGIMVYYSLLAATKLEEEGIHASVINMHTIKPIDSNAIIKAAKKTGKIVTVEEHQIDGGLGSAVAEVLVENYPVRMKRIGMPNCFGESGSAKNLLKKYMLTESDIVKAVKGMLI